MPTFTTIALESLLEPNFGDSSSSYRSKSSSKSSIVADFSNRKRNDEGDEVQKQKKTRNRLNTTPALYITPEPTPILHSESDSLSPSPYVVNRKGRGGKSVRQKIDGFEVGKKKEKEVGEGERCLEDEKELQFEELVGDNFLVEERVGDRVEEFVVDDGFLDARCDSLSVGSDTKDLGVRHGSLSVASNQGDFFDADDEFSSDGSISTTLSCGRNIDSEMRSTRLSLFEEIDKRKTAEDALDLMYNQWQRICNLLSAQMGLKFPSPPNESSMKLDIDSLEQFSQEVIVARFVSEAIGKGLARAEAEQAAEEIIKVKDQEISRLRDRLQYYEAVNREMSQRNQEVIEVARRQRHKKKGLQRWLWGGIGLSIAVGASVIALSCLPQTSENGALLTSTGSSDASCTN